MGLLGRPDGASVLMGAEIAETTKFYTAFSGDRAFAVWGNRGEAIPLAARICAVADVYDALASPRSYKDPFPDEKCLAILEKDAGTHFDPEIVEIFIEIFDVIKAIRDKFKETAHV